MIALTLNAHLENKMFELFSLVSLPISNIYLHARIEEGTDYHGQRWARETLQNDTFIMLKPLDTSL